MRNRRMLLLLGGAVTALIVLVGAIYAYAATSRSGSEPADSPAGPVAASQSGFYVDAKSPAVNQVKQWEADRPDDAAQIRKIAERPVALWVSSDVDKLADQVRDYTERAVAAKQKPLLVAYNIPGRDCGSYSAGGAPDGGSYRSWISTLATGLEGRGATVILEPDAVAQDITGCVEGEQRDERYALLTDATGRLKAAGAVVYIDAGHPGFVTDVDKLVSGLQRAGIAKADGFSLNVSNFYPTADVIKYGNQVSGKLGGKHYVIDTSRNGQGNTGATNGAPGFCNPNGRGLGHVPTTDTGDPRVDALLWIKRPGESDGACRQGEPPAGQWWSDYALGLAKRSVGS